MVWNLLVKNLLSSESYTPLSSYFIIQDSIIHGKGIFCKIPLFTRGFKYKYEDLRKFMSHVYVENRLLEGSFDSKLYRTPLGGFINHSDTPNCTINEIVYSSIRTPDFRVTEYYLHPLRDIEEGEEITVNYSKEICGVDYNNKYDWNNQSGRYLKDVL